MQASYVEVQLAELYDYSDPDSCGPTLTSSQHLSLTEMLLLRERISDMQE